MVTIEEAKQQISQRELELEQAEAQAAQAASQRIPQRRFGGQVTPQQQRQALSRRTAGRQIIPKIKEARQQLQSSREQVSQAESQQQQAQKKGEDFEKAQEVFISDDPRAIFTLENEEQRKFYNLLIQGRQAAENQFITDLENQYGDISPQQEQAIKEKLRSGGQITIADIRPGGISVPQSTPFGEGIDFPNEPVFVQRQIDREINVFTNIEEQGFLDKLSLDIKQERFSLERGGDTNFKESFKLVGLGAAASFVGTAKFGSELITKPIQTSESIIKGVGSKVVDISKFVTGKGEAPFKSVGRTLETSPAFSTGFIGAEIAQFKAPTIIRTSITKISDEVRTIGLKEISSEKIIAKEFFRGQTFPEIRKGQTAGELLGEFKPKLPGEKKPGGFTAAASPLETSGDLGKIITKRGFSEFPGLYQAPDLSPNFLRIIKTETSKKLFTTKLTDTLRPSIFRITPTSFELVPGVRKGQTRLGDIKIARDFFERAPKGKSFIPFIKTEKEAIIPFDTELKQINKRFFIRFEGRKIPIEEFVTVSSEINVDNIIKKTTVSSKIIQERASSSRIGRRARFDIVSPLSSTSILKISSSRLNLPKIPSSFLSPSSSRLNNIIRGSSFIPQFSRNSRTNFPQRRGSSIFRSSTIITDLPTPIGIRRTPLIPKLNFKKIEKPLIRRKGKKGEEQLFIIGDITAAASGLTVDIGKVNLKKLAPKFQTATAIRPIPIGRIR